MFQSILSKPPLLNFIPFICLFVFFFCRSQRQSHRKVESPCFFSGKHIHSPGANISAKSKETAHCGRFGSLGTKKHKIKDGAWKVTEGMVGFSLVFHLFCKVSSDYRWIKQ